MNILDRLKEETREAHQNLEKLMYGEQLREGTLNLADYKKLILTHFFVIEAIESQLDAQAFEEKFPELMYEKRRKLPALRRDLEILKITEPQNRLKIDFFKTPAAFWGALYVVEGSTLGGEIIHRMLRKSTYLATVQSFSYFGIYGDAIRENWIKFKNLLGENVLSPEDEYVAIEEANKTFVLYAQVFSQL